MIVSHRELGGYLGDVEGLTPQQSAALLNLGLQYAHWRARVLTVADDLDNQTLRNLVDSASRSYNRLLAGDLDQGDALKRTMANTLSMISDLGASTMSLQDVTSTTARAISDLVVSVAHTAGAAAGAAVAAAAEELGVDPADVGSGIGKVAIAVVLVGAGFLAWQVNKFLRR